MTREEKQKAIEYFKWWKLFNEHNQKAIPKDTIAYKAYQTEIGFYDLAIKALEQEPFINKDCISSGVCEHDKNKALDKIRAEIEQNAYPIVHGVNNHEKGMTLYGILQIIDKYKTESEEE
jgi:hypothetical protein